MRSRVSGREVGAVKVCVLSSKEETLGSPGRPASECRGGVSGLEARMEPGCEPGACVGRERRAKLFGDVEAWEPPP